MKIDKYSSDIRNELSGQLSWFADNGAAEDDDLDDEYIHDFEKEERLKFEYECAGMYFTGHPLDPYRFKLEFFSDYNIADIAEDIQTDGKRLNVCAMVSDVSVRHTKSGKVIASMKISDFSGSADMIVFENNYNKYRSVLKEGNVIYAVVNVNFRENDSLGELNLVSASDILRL